MFLLILGIVLFIGLIMVHEWGHFIAARRNGVKVKEYGIFFPPRLWSRKTKNGWLFSINALPIGGFVRLKGETDSDTRPNTFGSATFKVKAKIMLAGIAMNILVAFVLFMGLAFIGMPQMVDNQFSVKSDEVSTKLEMIAGYVEPGSPAEKAGLEVQDELVSLKLKGDNGSIRMIDSSDALRSTTEDFAGHEVVFTYKSRGEQYSKEVKLRDSQTVEASRKTDNPKGYLGVSSSSYEMKRYSWSAPVVAAGTMTQLTALTFQGVGSALVNLFTGNASEASEQVSGPVGIFAIMKSGHLLGYQFVLFLIALISLSLAIMNLLPIPALDGGKLFVTAVARLFKKRLSPKLEVALYGGSFILLIGFLVLITVVDVKRFF